MFLIVLLVVIDGLAGTYETTDGGRIGLKSMDGSPHKRDGALGPGKNLRWADLQNANLHKANLCFTDLRNAKLDDSNLTDADLHGAAIGGASLCNANLELCSFSGADLDGADFSGALNWKKAKWKGARYKQDAEPRWPKGFSPGNAGIIVVK